MFEIILISSWVFLSLVIWFKSDAFQEYAKLFSGDKFFLICAFEEKQKKDLTLDYHSYLARYHDSFFVKLITCPICLSVWFTLIFCVVFGNLLVFPIANTLALITFYIFNKLSE